MHTKLTPARTAISVLTMTATTVLAGSFSYVPVGGGEVRYTDPNCGSFSMADGVVTCADQGGATPTPSPTPSPTGSPTPTPTPTPSPTASPSPTPSNSKCPTNYVVPRGTSVVELGQVDEYAKMDWDTLFARGLKLDTGVAHGQIKSFAFINNNIQKGFLTGNHGNYGPSSYKDWSVSYCPGDFSENAVALKLRRLTMQQYYSSDGSQGATFPRGEKLYLNVRATDGTSTSVLVGNVPQAALP